MDVLDCLACDGVLVFQQLTPSPCIPCSQSCEDSERYEISEHSADEENGVSGIDAAVNDVLDCHGRKRGLELALGCRSRMAEGLLEFLQASQAEVLNVLTSSHMFAQ